MNPVPPHSRDPAEIEREAARWVLRRDRGLTAAEQDEFSQWLAADSRHGEALALHRWGWDELDRLTGLQTSLGAVPDPDLFAPRTRTRAKIIRWFAPLTLGLAATVAALFYFNAQPAITPGTPTAGVATQTPSALAAPCERQTLDDGSVVELNRGASIEVAFTAAERRVRLVRGEANFTVAKNPARPFIVSAGGVDVRAVGTVFNVRFDQAAVEVVVSEGRVKVDPPAGTPAHAETLLSVGQSAVVSLASASPLPHVATLSEAEVAVRLAWRPRLLDFTATPLTDIVAEFNRRNPVQIVVADPALEAERLSASFRSDNVEGFVHLMESDFGMKAEWRNEREIVLHRAQ
jgi:transmembrane sensor